MTASFRRIGKRYKVKLGLLFLQEALSRLRIDRRLRFALRRSTGVYHAAVGEDFRRYKKHLHWHESFAVDVTVERFGFDAQLRREHVNATGY
jgi:hypothetical protein